MKKAIFYVVLNIICGMGADYLLKGTKLTWQLVMALALIFISGAFSQNIFESPDKEHPKYYEEPKE